MKYKYHLLFTGLSLALYFTFRVATTYTPQGNGTSQTHQIKNASTPKKYSTRASKKNSLSKAFSIDRLANTGLKKMADSLLKSDIDFKTRSSLVWKIASYSSIQAYEILARAIKQTDDPRLIKILLEAIAHHGSSASEKFLLNFTKEAHPNELLQKAIEGLANGVRTETMNRLVEIYSDEIFSKNLRIQAAISLGSFSDANNMLVESFQNATDPELLEGVLEGLGKQDFANNLSFYNNIFISDKIPADTKHIALENLSINEEITGNFFISIIADNPDADLRSDAAWSFGEIEEEAHLDYSKQLTNLLNTESNSEVRTQIYNALQAHDAFSPNQISRILETEVDDTSFLAGAILVGHHLQEQHKDLTEFRWKHQERIKLISMRQKIKAQREKALYLLKLIDDK